jgi:hypothetical protein
MPAEDDAARWTSQPQAKTSDRAPVDAKVRPAVAAQSVKGTENGKQNEPSIPLPPALEVQQQFQNGHADERLGFIRLDWTHFEGGRWIAATRVADYFRQLGLSGAGLQQETSRVLGGFATIEGVAHGFRSGLRLLSLMMLAIGSTVAILLTRAGKGLRAPPGSGYL